MSSLPNEHLRSLSNDFLYHLGYAKNELFPIFGDVKFVVIGGNSERMKSFAALMSKELNHTVALDNICKTERFVMYKVGPVLSISHGMGMPSMSILLHEVIKALYYAERTDAIIIRIGSSGGLGNPAGTVIISNKAYNAFSKEEYEIIVLGEKVVRPAILDENLASEIIEHQDDKSFLTILGGTMGTDCFYEGQGRLDGAFCEHDEEKKLAYLHTLYAIGVRNIEMECVALAAMCHKAKIKCADVCATFLDRLQGDQVTMTEDQHKEWDSRPSVLVVKFIKSRLSNAANATIQ